MNEDKESPGTDTANNMKSEGIRLWVDDVRDPPSSNWVWAKTYNEAVCFLDFFPVAEVSLDHDLGPGKTGYDLAVYMETMAAAGVLDKLEWHVHSFNPVGSANIRQAMLSCERYW